MLKNTPLFEGRSSKDQIVKIISVIGSPTVQEVGAMNRNYEKKEFPKVQVLPFEANFPPTTSKMALEFLK